MAVNLVADGSRGLHGSFTAALCLDALVGSPAPDDHHRGLAGRRAGFGLSGAAAPAAESKASEEEVRVAVGLVQGLGGVADGVLSAHPEITTPPLLPPPPPPPSPPQCALIYLSG